MAAVARQPGIFLAVTSEVLQWYGLGLFTRKAQNEQVEGVIPFTFPCFFFGGGVLIMMKTENRTPYLFMGLWETQPPAQKGSKGHSVSVPMPGLCQFLGQTPRNGRAPQSVNEL